MTPRQLKQYKHVKWKCYPYWVSTGLKKQSLKDRGIVMRYEMAINLEMLKNRAEIDKSIRNLGVYGTNIVRISKDEDSIKIEDMTLEMFKNREKIEGNDGFYDESLRYLSVEELNKLDSPR